MKNITAPILLIALCVASAPAFADKAAYCKAYARDFADQSSVDQTLWQHKYQIAIDACLAKHTSVQPKPMVFRPKTKNMVPAAPAPKPVVVEETKPVPKPEVVATAKPVIKSEAKPAGLIAGSAEWNDYCAKKYVSFNAKNGTYQSKTGVERKCLVSK